MKIGTVLGEVQLEKQLEGFETAAFFQVRLEEKLLVAADLLGVRPGDLVLVVQGCAARDYRMDLCCDALILGKVENRNNG